MDSICHDSSRRCDRNVQLCARLRTITVAQLTALSRFSFPRPRLLMGCTKMILARASSLRASKKRDSEQLGAEIKREKESREGLWALTMGYCYRSRWYSYTNYGNDRSIPSSSSLSFVPLSLFFFLSTPRVSISLRSHRRRTLVASRGRCCPCAFARN